MKVTTAGLNRCDRHVLLASELTEEEVTLIAEAEAPSEFAYLDAELEDWRG